MLCLDETNILKKERIIPNYRNPIYLAKEYARMIETGEAKSENDLALKMGFPKSE
jgi:hypothetical protein